MGMYDITVESPAFNKNGRRPKFYRIVVVMEALLVTRRGVTNIIEPFAPCKDKEPLIISIAILHEGLGIQMSATELANYFGVTTFDIKKLIAKHHQLMLINRFYKNNYTKVLDLSIRSLNAL